MPAHVNQFSAAGRFPNGADSRPYDCTVACGMMALDDFTGGAIRPTATEFRARQNDRSGGIGLNDVAVVWKSYGLPTFTNGSKGWGTIMDRLRAGKPCILQGQSGALGAYAVGRSVPHAIYATRATPGGMLIVHDPLRNGPIAIPERDVQRFYFSGFALAGWGTGTYGGRAATPSTSSPVAGGPSWLADDAHVLTAADLRALQAWVLAKTPAATRASMETYLKALLFPNPLTNIGATNYEGHTLGELRGAAPGLFDAIPADVFGKDVLGDALAGIGGALGDASFVLVIGGLIAALFVLGAWRLTSK